jgi:hypothetical protein
MTDYAFHPEAETDLDAFRRRHESARTTGLYDRRDDEITLDEVERVGI